jgi:pilus assembly protein TadC
MAAGAVVGGGAVFGGLIGGVIALPPAMAVAVLVRRLREQEALTAGEPLSGLPLALDLIAVALRAGAPTPLALAVVADAVTGELRARLAQVAGLLRLGADPAQAWSAVRGHPDLAAVAVVAMRSADSGIRLADAFERQAEQLRDNGRSEAIARAHRVATFGLLPLGTCFLPAFVCLGIVPIVAGVAGEVFGPIAR